MSCSYADNGPSAYWESTPIANKNHTCCECGSTIEPGEMYHKIKGIWEGIFDTHKTCQICEKVRLKAMAGSHGHCICFGELWETVGVEYEI
ncbi:hypothetical protein DRJ16_06415 [Candidatus Woesearchaeota archaeon]|nr:MAG: hypothetical protein DRJ16_06415 [Candidatus Woesearchaeota archaeon]